MKIRIKVGKHVIHAELDDNETAEKWYQSLPVTVVMMNLYGREMCYRMGNGSLPVKGTENRKYVTGDICYRPPAGGLVILYGQNGESCEQVRIGHTDDDLSFLQGMCDTEVIFEQEV